MKNPDYINLERTFKILLKDKSNKSFRLDSFNLIRTSTKSDLTWKNLLDQRLCVILAEAGSGKTSEFKAQAERLKKQGKKAFFIRIENITSHTFFDSVHVEREIDRWLDTLKNKDIPPEKAYFFLDAVDEACLKDPNAFFNALNVFARKVYNSIEHCSIFISSRPCSWKYEEDEKEIKTFFQDISLNVYVLQPLNQKQITKFCETLEVENYSEFLKDVNSSNLMSLASRPFDLTNMLNIWESKGVIESRSQLIEDSIELKLKDNPRRTATTFKQRMGYAKRLAASTLLTGNSAIKQGGHIEEGVLIAQDVMKDCTSQQIQEILSCAIFDDILYGKVRFRHRELRDYLAAKWFHECLMKNRREVEKLLFQTVFQEQVIPQLYVAILPWLALFDHSICQRVIQVRPEILLENGDSASLSLDCQKSLIFHIVERITNNTDLSKLTNFLPNVYRIKPELDDYLAEIIDQHLIKGKEPITFESSRVLNFLIQLVAQENLPKCLQLTSKIALDDQYDDDLRTEALGSAFLAGSVVTSLALWSQINLFPKLPKQFLREILNFSVQHVKGKEKQITSLLLTTFALVKIDQSSDFPYMVHNLLKMYVDDLDSSQAHSFLKELNKLVIEDIDTYFTPIKILEAQPKLISFQAWLMPIIVYIIERFITKEGHLSFDIEIFKALFAISANFYKPTFDEWKAQGDIRESLGEIKRQFSKQKELKLNFVKSFIHLFAPVEENLSFEEYNAFFNKLRGYDYFNFRGGCEDNNAQTNFTDALEYAQDNQNHILVRHFFLSIAIPSYHDNNCCDERKGKIEALIESEANFQGFKNWLKPLDVERFADVTSEETKSQIEQSKSEKQNRQAAIEKMLETVKKDPKLILMNGDELTLLQKELIRFVKSTTKKSQEFPDYSDWTALEEQTNTVVAEYYKMLLKQFWRKNKVYIEGNTYPHSYFIGLSGLDLEFKEQSAFLEKLSNDEVILAIEYAIYTLNKFPIWFEPLYLAHPELFKETICSYLESEQGLNLGLFSKILGHSPWLHQGIAPRLIELLRNNFEILSDYEILCLIAILVRGLDCLKDLTILIKQIAETEIQSSNSNEEKAFWYALLFESSPTNTIVAQFSAWILSFQKESAIEYIAIFLKILMEKDPVLFNCLTPEKPIHVLKELYILICEYFPFDEDIVHKSGICYHFGERDLIQKYRDKLFTIISESKTKDGFYALKDLADLPNTHTDRRIGLKRLAYDVATECASQELFLAQDIVPFEEKTIFQPKSIKEVYSTVISTLEDIKDHVEKGNFSPYKVWQTVCDEEEMRNLFAEQFYFRLQHFFIAQEYELANEQRLDLQVNYYNVKGSIPIELKMAQRWSGNELLEHLENQLIKDYLRHPSSPYGIFLIVNVADKGQKSWKINSKSVPIADLQETLQQFADNLISTIYSSENVQGVKVIVIDTLVRGTKFNR